MCLPKIYEKGKEQVVVNDKFIYCSSVYIIWEKGASLLEEKHYTSDEPIKFKKKDLKLKKKNYILYRYFDLEFAPEEWLQTNGYKLIKN